MLFIISIISGKLYWNDKIANARGQTGEITKTKANLPYLQEEFGLLSAKGHEV